DCEAEARLVRGLLGGDVARPDAVALLEPEGVDRAIAARDQPVWAAGLPERPPQRPAVFARDVQLPAELADVRHAKREDDEAAERDHAGGHVRERLIRQVARRQRLEDVPRL